MYYLDAAATTPVKKSVLDSMIPYFSNKFYNPSANYTPADDISDTVEKIRREIAIYIGCQPSEVYFTSGASESNSWAIQGWIKSHPKGRVITTNIEHDSILKMVEDPFLKPYFRMIPVDEYGYVYFEPILKEIEIAIKEGVEREDILVAVQYANNEIGTIQYISLLSDGVKKYGANFFTDATQYLPEGGYALCYSFLNNIDMMSMSGHKIGAPKGIGLLIVRDRIKISPLIYGTQNFGMRGGTENVPYIVALGEAFRLLAGSNRDQISYTRRELLRKIGEITPIKENGGMNHLGNNINITFLDEDISGQNMVNILSAIGVYISMGSACSAHDDEPSHVLKAIGLTDEEISRTIRITIPHDFKDKDIPDVVAQFKKAIDLIKESKK